MLDKKGKYSTKSEFLKRDYPGENRGRRFIGENQEK